MSEPIHDEIDRRLLAALCAVEVPAELQSRLERALDVAVKEEKLLESPSILNAPQAVRHGQLRLRNRRTAIATALAAGIGGIVFGYRQMTQPLSQLWLAESSQNMLLQVKRMEWQPLGMQETVALKQSLQDVGFLPQVRNIAFRGFCQLQPPRNVQSATAYDLANELVLLELIVERGVHGVSRTLSQLPWSRSDAMAMAMSNGKQTLVLAGSETLQSHILPHRTT